MCDLGLASCGWCSSSKMSEAELKERMRKVHWVPLESNPDVLNTFCKGVGMPNGWEWTDVFGVDEELLGMVPQPCLALTLLFQCTEKISAFKKAQRESIESSGQKVSPEVVYLKQYV